MKFTSPPPSSPPRVIILILCGKEYRFKLMNKLQIPSLARATSEALEGAIASALKSHSSCMKET